MKTKLALYAVIALLALDVPLSHPHPVPTRPLAALAPVVSNGTWTVYHHDDAHSGADSSLPNATSATQGWTSATLDAEVFAEPLIYGGRVFVATLNNTVYALNQSDGTELWHMQLGAPTTTGWSCGNVSPQGILGTPVIDPVAKRIYVVTLQSDHIYRVVGLDLLSGTPQLTTQIPSTIGTGFDWTIQQQRGALGIGNGYVYVPFGGRAGDCGSYHGWVVGVPVSGGSPTVYQTPNSGIGIWAAGGVAVDDSTGSVFAATGNGVSSGCSAVNQNDAVVKLAPSTLALQDYFMPPDWQANWCSNDQDLGSAGPLLINPGVLFQAGKWGGGFLIDPRAMGHVNGQRFPAAAGYSQAEVCFGNHSDATFGSFAYSVPFIYVECEGKGLVALRLDLANPALPTFKPCDSTCGAPDWHAGGSATFGPPIVAGGAVWVASNGGLSAFNAATGAQIYQSAAFGINRFVTPAEAGGQVFVPSHRVIREFDMHFVESLGGILTSAPGAASWGSSRDDAFVRGTDNAAYHISSDGAGWSGWESLGGDLASAPGAASWAPNRIDVFVKGTDQQLWHKWWYGSAWSGWQPLGGALTSTPAAAAWSANRLDVFVRGTDLQLWHQWWDGASWSGWQPLGGSLASAPAVTAWSANRLDVFMRGNDNALWHKWWDGANWSSWESLGGTIASAPTVSSCGYGELDVYALGPGNDILRKTFNTSGWNAWQSLGGAWTSDPAAVCRPGTTAIDLFARGADNALWHQAQRPG
jgi:outer membrane protein assembly factor BamB